MAKNLKKAKSFRFSDDELKLLDALKDRYGSYNRGIIAAVRDHLHRDEPSNDELLEILRKRLCYT